MAKKKATGQSWGPYYETYIKFDHDGVEWEQEVPCYREVATSLGTFGIPPKYKMTFVEAKDKDGEPVTVPEFTLVKTAKARKPKKVETAKKVETVDKE